MSPSVFNNEPTLHSDDEGEPEEDDDEDEEEDDEEEDDTREEHSNDEEDADVKEENGISGTTDSPEKTRSPVRRCSRNVRLCFIV